MVFGWFNTIFNSDKSGEDGTRARQLGVMFRDLCVVGLGAGAAVQHSVLSLLSPKSIWKYIYTLRHPPLRDIISGFEGAVLPGEMLRMYSFPGFVLAHVQQSNLTVVLGRPGSGCSTFLKTLANHRGDYHSVHGDIFYDSFTPDEIGKRYRGDVIYCPEDDAHFPTLTVRQTLEFASSMRTPSRQGDQSRMAHAVHTAELLMRIFGLEHAKNTVIGDASIRGISGGEKKRVSLAEVMSARGKLVCWDKYVFLFLFCVEQHFYVDLTSATRGLDSSTALEFIQVLRAVTDTANVTTVVSIYQAGEQLFDLFDKVCLIYEGKMVYFGSAKEAKQYFMDIGYEPQDRQTTPDFLVASTSRGPSFGAFDVLTTVTKQPIPMPG